MYNEAIYKNISRDYTWWDSIADTLWTPIDWLSSFWNTPYSLIGSLFSWSNIHKLHSFVYSYTRSLKIEVDVSRTLGYNFFGSEQMYYDADLLKVLHLALKEIKRNNNGIIPDNDLSSMYGGFNYSQSYQICILYYRTLLCSLINIYRRYQGQPVVELQVADAKKERLLSFEKFFPKVKEAIIDMHNRSGMNGKTVAANLRNLDPYRSDSMVSIESHIKPMLSASSDIQFVDVESFYDPRIGEIRNKTKLAEGCVQFYDTLFKLEYILHHVADAIERQVMLLMASAIRVHSRDNVLSIRSA